jgi:hypothetical protein
MPLPRFRIAAFSDFPKPRRDYFEIRTNVKRNPKTEHNLRAGGGAVASIELESQGLRSIDIDLTAGWKAIQASSKGRDQQYSNFV